MRGAAARTAPERPGRICRWRAARPSGSTWGTIAIWPCIRRSTCAWKAPCARRAAARAALRSAISRSKPEGNTAELEELDKVLIEVEGPKARVGLGGSGPGGQFGHAPALLASPAGVDGAGWNRGERRHRHRRRAAGRVSDAGVPGHRGEAGALRADRSARGTGRGDRGRQRAGLAGRRGAEARPRRRLYDRLRPGRADVFAAARDHGADPGGRGLPVQRVRLPAQPLPRGGPRHARRRRASTGRRTWSARATTPAAPCRAR